MSNVMYYPSNVKTRQMIPHIVQRFDLKECYHKNREIIWKNKDMLLKYNKHYIYIMAYDEKMMKKILMIS